MHTGILHTPGMLNYYMHVTKDTADRISKLTQHCNAAADKTLCSGINTTSLQQQAALLLHVSVDACSSM
jgi:hypothetical protein